MRSLLLVALIILAMVLAKIFLFKSDKPEDKSRMPATAQSGGNKARGPMPVDVFLAKEQTNNDLIYAAGTLVANEEVELKSEAAGRITQLSIKEGSYINKGQLIAKINDADILAKLKKVKYEEELAMQIEARQKKLLEINAISKEEYDIALNKINTLSADKESLLVALAQTELRAPFSGRIGLKNISVGAYVNPGTMVATLVQTNPMKMDFTIPEKYASRVKSGGKVEMSIEGINGTKSANIVAIDPKIDEVLRTVKIRSSLPNPHGNLMPGMFTKVNVPLGQTRSIMIPSEIIVPFVGGKKVYVIKGGTTKETSIVTGLRTDTQVEVLSGLNVGDSLVASAIMNIKNDQDVKAKKIINP